MVTDASVHVMQISRGGGLNGVTGFPSAPDRRKPLAPPGAVARLEASTGEDG
jgi:hypothetical protein